MGWGRESEVESVVVMQYTLGLSWALAADMIEPTTGLTMIVLTNVRSEGGKAACVKGWSSRMGNMKTGGGAGAGGGGENNR